MAAPIFPKNRTKGDGVQPFFWRLNYGAIAALSAAGCHAAITQPASGTTVVTTQITNPDVPRNVSITGNQASCTGNVVVEGTDVEGNALSETIAANGTSKVVGNKAFATVTSITIPARGASGDTIVVGYDTKIGIGGCLDYDTVLNAFFGGVREGTRPTIAKSSTVVASNTFILNSTLDGSAVVLDLYL